MLIKIFLWLFIFWIILWWMVQPYKGICPRNADCGVYVHCHQGYKYIGGKCEVTAEVKMQIESICISVVENLKY